MGYDGTPWQKRDLEYALQQPLVKAVEKHNVDVFGSENPQTAEKALAVGKAYLMNSVVDLYPGMLDVIAGLEQESQITNHSSREFKQKFFSIFNTYLSELAQFRKDYPLQDISEKSLMDLVDSAREADTISIIKDVSSTGIHSIAIKWGGAHIPNFVRAFCNSDYTIFVALQQDIPEKELDEMTKRGEMQIPEEINKLGQVLFQMNDYFNATMDEAGLK